MISLVSFLPGSSSGGFRILHPLAPQSLAVPRHSSLMLECVVSGLPPASIRWVKDGRDALRKGRWKLLHSHLVTDRLEASDSGNYSCVVGNEFGVMKYVNYSLTILGKKEKKFSRPGNECFGCILAGFGIWLQIA